MKTKKTLYIIPHSHWDREWYMSFEKHRARLVTLIDTLIETMESDESFTHYHLDGQYIVIDDYLEIRPKMRDRLLRLVREGRISVGPWYVLQDEYLTGGESNIRNMLYGMRFCREAGVKPLACGYFPDAFGNISQAPQILRGFGIDNAVFGRGVNDVGANNTLEEKAGIFHSELTWRAPDGSEVLGVMFSNWYCNAMELPEEPEALRTRIAEIAAAAEKYALTDYFLGMNGCDHQPVQTNLSRVIALANAVQDKVTVKQSGFEEYIDKIRLHRSSLPLYEGEINGQLTSGSCPLICTASAHIDIKQDNYRIEHLLARVAEPVAVLNILSGGRYDEDTFLYAWKKLMQNHPHDSICACSCDEVYREMKTRFAKAEAVAEHLRDEYAERITAGLDTTVEGADRAITVFSLDPHERRVTVRAYADFEPEEGVKAVALIDKEGKEIPSHFTVERNCFTYTLPKDSFRKVRYTDRFTVEAELTLSGIGTTVLGVVTRAPETRCALRYTEKSAENEHLKIELNENGSFDLTEKDSGRVLRALNVFEDTKDEGNLYNYMQAEGDAAVRSDKGKAAISLFKVTPFSVTFKTKISVFDNMDIASFITLKADAKRVDIRTEVTNRGENHRLRALFESDVQTKSVFAEGQFDVVRRDITPAPAWKNPCNAQRMQAFVTLEEDDGGEALMISTRGLAEYEVLRDGKNTLALTLLRAVGEIGDWGRFPTPEGQKKGCYTLEYAVIPYKTKHRAKAYNEGYSYAYPAALALGCECHGGKDKASADVLTLDNDYIRLSAFKSAEGGEGVILRLFNTHTEDIRTTLGLSPLFKSAALTNLAEETGEALSIRDGRLTLDIGAKKIVTLLFKTE